MTSPSARDDHSRTWVREDRRNNSDRRCRPDRRDDLRFEPGKTDRRKNPERRQDRRSAWDTLIAR